MSEKTLGEQNYEAFARRYAEYALNKPYNAYYDRPAVLSQLPDLQGKRVLDAGCGPGIYAELLLERGADLVAFDVTPEFVKITQEKVGDRATVVHGNLLEPLDFAADAEFDVVVCPLVLDYIEDWEPTFREFQRVLKTGGVLVFSAGHPQADWEWVKRRQPDRDWHYFDVEQFSMEWGGFGDPKPLITSYRRPLGAMVNPLIAAGLTLDHVLENQPTEAFKVERPERYEKLIREPGFITIRAIKR